MEQGPKVHTQRDLRLHTAEDAERQAAAGIAQRIPGWHLVDLTVAVATTLGFLESSVPPVLPGSHQVALKGFGVDGAWACLLGDKQDIVRANSDTGPTKHPVGVLGEEGSSLSGHWEKHYPRADWIRTGSQEGADSRNRTEEGPLSTETEGKKERCSWLVQGEPGRRWRRGTQD